MIRPSTAGRPILRAVRQGELWCAFLALSLSLSISSAIVPVGTSASPLTSFADRAISPAVIEGIDVTSVGRSYGQFYLVLGISFFGLLILLGWLNGAIRRRVPVVSVAKEQSGILLLSQFALALFALQVVTVSVDLSFLRAGLHLLTGLVVLVMVAKAVTASVDRGSSTKLIAASLLDDSELLIAGLFFPVPLLFASILAAGGPFALPGGTTASSFVIYAMVLVGLGVLYLALIKRALGEPGAGLSLGLFNINNAVIVAGVPIILIPIAMPIANELQHIWADVSPSLMGAVLVSLLIAAAAVLFYLQSSRRLSLDGSTVVVYGYFPILIATLATFASHRQTVVMGHLDLLKLGESTVPTQQLLRFGSVPFLDLMPTHGFSDLATQTFYSLLNGYQGLDMIIWSSWGSEVSFHLLVFAFLAVTTSPVVAVLATVLLPVKALIAVPYAIVLLPAIALVAAIRRPTFVRFLVLWLLAVGLVLWRWEQGSVAAIALLVIVTVLLTERREAIAPAIKSLGVVIAIVPLALIVLDVLWVGSSLDTVRTLFATHSPRMSAEGATSETPRVAITLRYFLLPAVAILVLLYYGVRRLVGPDRTKPRTYAVLFASIFSLVVAVRSAVWPALGSWFDPVLFLAVLAVTPYCWDSANERGRIFIRSTVWLLAVFVLSVPLGSTAWGHLSESFDELNLVQQDELFRFHTWREGERRVVYDQGDHTQIAHFLDAELEEDETFFDLTDGPLLYLFTDREFPTSVIPNRSRSSETIQSVVTKDLESLRDDGRLPLVLFRKSDQESKRSFELPIEVRSYRIAEYIYQHYVPYVDVGGYEVWRQSGHQLSRNREMSGRRLQAATLSQDFWLGRLPFIWAHFDPEHAIERTEILSVLHERLFKLDTNSTLQIPVDLLEADRSEGNYLQVRARPVDGAIRASTRNGGPILSLEYGQPRSSAFHFELIDKPAVAWDVEASHELAILPEPTVHTIERLDREGRHIFRSKREDPHLSKFVDLEGAPAKEKGNELWLRLRYRSSLKGMLQIFFATDRSGFSEEHSIRIEAKATGIEGAVSEVAVPVIGRKLSFQLTDLRIDPPSGSDFEIVGVEVGLREPEFDDYLVRLSSQWRWASSDVGKLILKSSGPVLIDQVLLRRGD